MAIIIFTSALLFIGPNLYEISPAIVDSIFICVPLIYIFMMIVAPLFLSQPMEDLKLRHNVPNSKIKFRLSKRQPTRALDIGFYRCIIINETDWDDKRENWRALIGHEHAHIKNMDTLFFHFVGLGLNIFIALAGFRLLVFIYEIISFESQSFDPTLHASPFELGTNAFMLTLVTYLFMTWVKNGLHNREYLADAAAYHIDSNAIEKWLKDRIFLSQLSPIKSDWFSINPILSWMTHPSFQSRLDFLEDKLKPSNFSIYSNAFHISMLIYANLLLLLLLLEGGGSVNNGSSHSQTLVYVFIPLLLFATAGVASLYITENVDMSWHLLRFVGVNFLLQIALLLYIFYDSELLDASYLVLPTLFLFYVIGVFVSAKLIRYFTKANLYGFFMQCILIVIGILSCISGRLLLGVMYRLF